MIQAYNALAKYYDRFTLDVPYERFVDFYECLFAENGRKPRLVLDLACGTGSITRELSRRGYEVIGADTSQDMLSAAYARGGDFNFQPVYLCQKMSELDLFGTVDACVCALDSINYITDENELKQVFGKVALFLEKDGLFIFDVNTEHKFSKLDNTSYVRECEDAFCVYQAEYSSPIIEYQLDLFEKTKNLWRRSTEIHRERAYDCDKLISMLEDSGFCDIELFAELEHRKPRPDEERIFIKCKGIGLNSYE